MKEPYFTIFCGKLCRIGQDHAEPGEKQDHRSDRKWVPRLVYSLLVVELFLVCG